MTHGLRKLETVLKNTERKLDGRGRVMRMLKQRALDWAEDVGGMVHLSSRQQTLLWHTAAVFLMVESILHWALAQESLLDGKGEMLPPLRKSLIAYLNAERRGLETLGLKPERSDVEETPQEYLTRVYGTPGHASPTQGNESATVQTETAPDDGSKAA